MDEAAARTYVEEVLPAIKKLGVVQWPNEVLSTPAAEYVFPDDLEVAASDYEQLVATVGELKKVYDFSKGVGLAAPQIGIPRQMSVLIAPSGKEHVLINPKIVKAGPNIENWEGCISCFGERLYTARPKKLGVASRVLDGQDRNFGFGRSMAALAAHEIDHLNGRVIQTEFSAAPKVGLVDYLVADKNPAPRVS